MIKTVIGATLCALALFGAAAPAMAQDDDDDWTFTVVNLTDQPVVFLKMAYPNGNMSADLIPQRLIDAGDSVAMVFPPEDQECEYWVYVTMADGSEQSADLSLCGIEGIYVSDDGLDTY
ncbi:hypothetical protein BH10PSE2_BH10PSE2_11850 [soil metagenome]